MATSGRARPEWSAVEPTASPVARADAGDESAVAPASVDLGLLTGSAAAGGGPSQVDPAPILGAQGTLGNQAVARIIHRQTAQRSGAAEPEVGLAGGPLSSELSGRIQRQLGHGAPLPPEVQQPMQSAFGVGFDNVHVHADAEADTLASSISADAFTIGSDVFFRQGAYAPGTAAGDEMLTHELTHVVQQAGSPPSSAPLVVGPADDRFEQAAAGTTAVQAGAGAQAVQRQVTINPVVISNDPGTQAAEQAQADAMMARFPEVARGFCRDWFEAATAAMATAPEPDDPYAARNFYVALAGNMAWAATSLSVAVSAVPGAGAAVIVTVSALGAGAGSGALSKAAPPSGKAAVTDRLTEMRGQFEARATNRDYLVAVVQEALSDDKTMSDPQAQDELLWKKFSDDKVPFADRVAFITTKLRGIIADWLMQFQQQYLAWKARDDVIKKAREYELGEESSGPFGDPIDIIADMLDIGTPADRFFDMVLQDIPLQVTFETH